MLVKGDFMKTKKTASKSNRKFKLVKGFYKGSSYSNKKNSAYSSKSSKSSSSNSYKSSSSSSKAMKEACLVFFYTGDSYVIRLAQETVVLKNYLKNYQKTVLLKHTDKIGGIDLSGVAKNKADIFDKPTKENFVKYIRTLAQEGYLIDVYIFGHGSDKSFRVSTGTNGSKGTITADYVTDSLSYAKTGFKKLPIRLVYQGICYGSTWNSTWKNLGAMCSVGAQYVNFYPNQMGDFIREWNKGSSVSTALKKSNTATSRTVVQTLYILPDALATRKEWGGCPFGKTVLGKHKYAKNYFSYEWGLTGSKYNSDYSGNDNMNNSSKMVSAGSAAITRNTKAYYESYMEEAA